MNTDENQKQDEQMKDVNSPEKSDVEKATPTTVDTDTAAADASKPQLEIESDIKNKQDEVQNPEVENKDKPDEKMPEAEQKEKTPEEIEKEEQEKKALLEKRQ